MDVNTKKVSLNLSLEEYLLDGNPITHMEAVVLFGVSCFYMVILVLFCFFWFCVIPSAKY